MVGIGTEDLTVTMLIDHALADTILRGLVLTAIAMTWVVVLVRVVGLRSFSKMTPFDFVMTVATGSLLAGAGQSEEWTGFLQAIVGISALFLLQYIAARLRKSSDYIEDAMQNEPIFLMRDGEIIDEALANTRVAVDDVYAKLREANALDLSRVHAVVLETTGDVSVLHGESTPDERLLEGVRTTFE
tara:strand:+ start:1201 stop:1761 length:561 start_codon:yes stop_codon:yes gene_type:complete